jgi:mRNA-degrading endonuclease toxin of MazEF toxin-antitoxin module
VRPVLILAATALGEPGDEAVVVAMITGSVARVSSISSGDILITEWQAANLKKPSVIRCRRIWSAERSDFRNVLGKLDSPTFELARVEVKRYMDF